MKNAKDSSPRRAHAKQAARGDRTPRRAHAKPGRGHQASAPTRDWGYTETGERPVAAAGLPPGLDPRRDPAKPGSRSRGRRIAVGFSRGIATVLAVILLASAGWATYLKQVAESNVNRSDAIPTEGNNAADGVDGTAMNILLVGSDDRTGATDDDLMNKLYTTADGGGLNTDTMLLVHIPADGKRASVVSFPRDSYVDIPGYGSGKLNSAYADGYVNAPEDAPEAEKKAAGQQLLVQTISGISGLHIDHYVEIGLLGFYNLATVVGGVEVNLCQPVDDAFSGLTLDAGPQLIEGANALAFVRQRHGLPNGDLDRIKRQQYFLGAVARKLMSSEFLLNPAKQQELITNIAQNLTVDQGLDLFQLAEQLQNLALGNLEFRTIPLGTPEFDTIDGQSVVKLAEDDQVKQFFAGLSTDPAPASEPAAESGSGSSASESAAPTVAPGDVAVEVLNGAGKAGIAAEAADGLRTLGYNVTGTANADSMSYPTTTIFYTPGQEASAQALQAAVPNAVLSEDPTGGGSLRLVLGQDFTEIDTSAADAGTGSDPAATDTATTPPPPDLTGESTNCIN